MSSTKFAIDGPQGPLRNRCAATGCSKTGPELLRCAACKAVRYCSRDHQVAHRPEHKGFCKDMIKMRAKLEKEDSRVRNAKPNDDFSPANAFESDVGRFWRIPSTRPYMQARFSLADHLYQLGTLDGVREALEHFLDMARLSRGDGMGVRDLIPPLMLRLDRDQDCYDFIKWWATTGMDKHYNWADMSLPHLDVRGADALEDVLFTGKEYRHYDLNHVTALLLLKLKLLVDTIQLKVSRKVSTNGQTAKLTVMRSPLSVQFQQLSDAELSAMETKLRKQVCRLGGVVREVNKYFMQALLDPEKALSQQLQSYSPGSFSEAWIVLQYSYAAWWEMEGVLPLLDRSCIAAAKASATEVLETLKALPNSDKTTRMQIMEEMGLKKMWHYLDQAVHETVLDEERTTKRHHGEQAETPSRDEDGDVRM